MMEPIDNKAVLFTWSSRFKYLKTKSILELAAGDRFLKFNEHIITVIVIIIIILINFVYVYIYLYFQYNKEIVQFDNNSSTIPDEGDL